MTESLAEDGRWIGGHGIDLLARVDEKIHGACADGSVVAAAVARLEAAVVHDEDDVQVAPGPAAAAGERAEEDGASDLGMGMADGARQASGLVQDRCPVNPCDSGRTQ